MGEGKKGPFSVVENAAFAFGFPSRIRGERYRQPAWRRQVVAAYKNDISPRFLATARLSRLVDARQTESVRGRRYRGRRAKGAEFHRNKVSRRFDVEASS